MSETGTWKTLPINAGLLIALATGMAATLLGGYGIQSWVDERVHTAIAVELIPVHSKIRELERRIGALRGEGTHYDAIYESLASIESLLQSHYARRGRDE